MSKKDAYIAKAQAVIDEQVAKLDQVKAQLKGGVADQKIEAYNVLEKMEAKLEQAKAQLKELTDAAEGQWESLTDRVETLTNDVSTAVKKFIG